MKSRLKQAAGQDISNIKGTPALVQLDFADPDTVTYLLVQAMKFLLNMTTTIIMNGILTHVCA